MKKKLFIWEMVGAVFIITLGTFLHFIYEWSDCFLPVAFVGAVNESVWEHLKIAFWPAFIYSIIESHFLSGINPHFWMAKCCALYLIPAAITCLFYTYTGVLGYNLLVADVLIFIISVFLGQFAAYKILLWRKKYPVLTKVAGILIILAVTAFSLFTFSPPQIPLFMDPKTGGFGIIKYP